MELNLQESGIGEWARKWVRDVPAFFAHPADIFRNYKRGDFVPDLISGMTVAFILLPQAIAYALIAELPPETGLYAAIVAAIVGALWGSSWHLHTGPTNAASLLVLSTLAPVLTAGSPEYVAAAAFMAVLVGVVRLFMGIARLGVLVNFVADSVIVGFTAGAGILIGVNQLRHLFGVRIQSSPVFLETVWAIARSVGEAHWVTFGLGVLTIVLSVGLKRLAPKLPATLISIVLVSAIVATFGLNEQGVRVLGELPRSFPPFAMPSFDYNLVRQIITGVLAVSLLGLIEAMSIARSIAAQTGQRIDSDQEFVGQGLASIAAGLFSGLPTSGSFTRSAVNYATDGKTPLAVAFSGVFVLLMMLILAPLAKYMPYTAIAGITIVMAYRMIDRAEMKHIRETSWGDTTIMYGTLFATLLLPIEFAVVTGVLIAFGRYIARTSTPEVVSVVPDESFGRMRYQPAKPICPQLAVVSVAGSLYFGATTHVEDEIRANMLEHPEQKYLLLRMDRINLCDITGVNMLDGILRLYRQNGGDLFVMGVRKDVLARLRASGFIERLGESNLLTRKNAIPYIFNRILDPALCVYRCPVRVWNECQTVPKSALNAAVPIENVLESAFPVERITAVALYEALSSTTPPLIVDVREPSEFEKDHITQAQLFPLSQILANEIDRWNATAENVVFVCRTGRRSIRAAHAIHLATGQKGRVLEGGMGSWVSAGLATEYHERPPLVA